MAYHDRVLRTHLVEIEPVHGSTLLLLRVVVHEADDPLSRRRFRGARAQGILHAGDAAEVRVHVLEFVQPSARRMRVSIDESGHDRRAGYVDHLGLTGCQIPDIRIRPNGNDPVSLDGEGLGEWRGVVLGEDVAVHHDRVGGRPVR